MGSGKVGVAALKAGLTYTGVEIAPGYFDIACQRVEEAYNQPDMLVAIEQPEPETLDLLA